ncbi:hypothetical protein [Chakrabartyella piscis]|uniref:hypothetical protein n=1 Tax=Chakrabartyella piscis TaxID=2918914 RepID=UPI002958B86E|nr:hypothetical protein [Chakrabartyella piscis]
MKHKKWRNISLVLMILLLLICACTEQTPVVEIPPVQEEIPLEEVKTPVVEQEDLSEEVDVQTEVEEIPLEEVEEVPEEEVTTPEKTQTEEDKPFWQSESTRQVNNLTSIATAAQSAYKKNGMVRAWVSNNGKLYGYYEKDYITTDDLVKGGFLESGLSSSEYQILYVKGSDLTQFSNMSVSSGQMGLTVFAATLYGNEYLIASDSGKIGSLSKADYTLLMSQYSSSHGDVSRLSSASADYTRILNFISLYDGVFEEYAVREIWMDNKYAVVTFSSMADLANIKQYILRNDANFWEVVYPNVQKEMMLIPSVNQQLPDFNLDLLPSYNIYSWLGKIVTEHDGAIAALFAERVITSADEVVYLCGVTNYVYAILENGNRYAIYIEDGNWTATYATSDYNAKNILEEKSGFDFGFLILDD